MVDSSSKILLVPVRLQVRYNSTACQISRPRLDLRGAQYYDGSTQSFHPQDVAGGISDPFLTRNYANPNNQATLPEGVYLHWSVTDALATLRQSPITGTGFAFARVPNRWLMTRRDMTSGQATRWVVESDALLTPNPEALAEQDPTHFRQINPNQLPAETYTQFPFSFELTQEMMVDANQHKTTLYAYRFLGRQVSFDDWSPTPPDDGAYLNDILPGGLTAMGYGEPTFAAIFSNSRTVFGCHDVPPNPAALYRYDVLGWYADPADDCVQNFWQIPDITSDVDRFTALEGEYRWAVAADGDTPFPTRSAYYASILLIPSQIDEGYDSGSTALDVDIALGNTGSEALAAYLANSLAGGDETARKTVEAQLEALPILHQLQSEQADAERRFEQLQHRRGFKPRGGGRLWAIREEPSGTGATRASQMPTNLPPQVAPLPSDVASTLDELNRAQNAYDRAQERLSDWQHRLFAEWYKFDLASYADPNMGVWRCWEYQQNLADYRLGIPVNLNGRIATPSTSREHLRQEIEAMLMLLAETGEILLSDDGQPVGVKALTLPSAFGRVFDNDEGLAPLLKQAAENSLAQAVWEAYQAVLQALSAYQATHPNVILTSTPAPRFWQPIEPFVMMSAGKLPALTDLYGHDGVLLCAVGDIAVAAGAPLDADAVLSLGEQTAALIPTPMQLTAPTRGLVLLEWGATIRAILARETQNPDPSQRQQVLAGTRTNPSGAGVDFLQSYLNETFQLTETSLDLELKDQTIISPTTSDFSGMAVLTQHSSSQAVTLMQRYLAGQSLLDLKQASLARSGQSESEFDDAALVGWYALKMDASDAPTEGADSSVWDAWFGQHFPFSDAEGVYLGGSADLLTWYEASPTYQADQWMNDSVRVYLSALVEMAGLNAIGQALGGFNNALLMREQVLQLPVYDLGLAVTDLKSRSLQSQGTGAIDLMSLLSDLIGGGNRSAPIANGYFMPIRTGEMSVTGLTLLDSFGRVYVLTPQTVRPALSMTPPSWDGSVAAQKPPAYLPPRIAQPAQTIFRWLSASDDGEELTIRPDASPICGWVMPNVLDGSLMVYDAAGNLLGSINAVADWEPAPAAQPPLDAGQIPNLHLRRVVNKLIVNALSSSDEAETLAGYLGNLLSALDSSMARIEPENFAQHESMAVLMGRPLAVVRARAGIQMMGEVQINQSFAAYLSTLYEARECGQPPSVSPFNDPLTNHYETVRVPLRVGERISSDGLVGYWREGEDGALGDVFFAPKAMPSMLSPDVLWTGFDAPDDSVNLSERPPLSIAVVRDVDHPTNILEVGLLDEAHLLTMLIDPRGMVHVSSGLLPVKAVGIPSEQYAPALKQMSVSFLIAPVLTSAAQPTLPLSVQAGAAWSWVSHPDATTWVKTPATTPADAAAPPAHVRGTSQAAVFAPQRLVEGWLNLAHSTDDDTTGVTSE